MKRFLQVPVLLYLMLCSWQSAAQCPTLTVKPEGATKEEILPAGFRYTDSVKSDFNKDGWVDLALLVALERIESSEEYWKTDCQRGVVILERTLKGYVVRGFSAEAVLCSGCGGVFGDPYAGMEFNKDVLKIKHFGGSNWKWTQDYTFRFQNNGWELIGLTHDNFYGAKTCNTEFGMAGRTLNDVNFSTGKQHVVRTKGMYCAPYKDQWLKFAKSKPITLNQFRVLSDYVPLKVN